MTPTSEWSKQQAEKVAENVREALEHLRRAAVHLRRFRRIYGRDYR